MERVSIVPIVVPLVGSPVVTYMAIVIHQIVGEFELVKGNNLPHPLASLGWRIRVEVNPSRCSRIRLACYQPGRAMEGIPIGRGKG